MLGVVPGVSEVFNKGQLSLAAAAAAQHLGLAECGVRKDEKSQDTRVLALEAAVYGDGS